MPEAAVPKVSVVMSVYDDAARLERAVASILDQDFRELELLVVDDGSTDGSGELLDRLAAADPRLRVLHQNNRGLTLALIRGCAEARGEFIARQDSDDWSHAARIGEQLALLESNPRIGFASCATQYVGPADEVLLVVSRPGAPAALTEGLLHHRQGPPAHGSVMFRRDLYETAGGYREEFRYAQDSALWLRRAERMQFACLPEVRYFHRKEIESTSGARRPAQRRFGELGHLCRQARAQGRDEAPFLLEARQLSAALRDDASRGAERGASAATAYLLGSQLVRNGNPRARDYLWQAIRLRPWHWRAWLRLAQSTVMRG